jgi:maltose O-acetyltransferase
MILGPLDITGPGDANAMLSFGEETLITGPLHIDLGAFVEIGDRVRMGHHVVLLTLDHEIGPHEHRCGRKVAAPIRIGDGVWLGSRVTVLPGVSIGNGAVVAAGSVVTHDVAPDTMVAGVPAKVVRSLDDTPPRSTRRDRLIPVDED